MRTIIDLQIASDCSDIPRLEQIQSWLDLVLAELQLSAKEVTIRVVDGQEIKQLNFDFRGKDKTTNVLSFPFDMPDISFAETEQSEVENASQVSAFLGDIVICAPVVKQEAIEQNKPIVHHWAHMLLHGTLHLLGYDHIEEQDADEMEDLEIALLAKLGIDDPYQNH